LAVGISGNIESCEKRVPPVGTSYSFVQTLLLQDVGPIV